MSVTIREDPREGRDERDGYHTRERDDAQKTRGTRELPSQPPDAQPIAPPAKGICYVAACIKAVVRAG